MTEKACRTLRPLALTPLVLTCEHASPRLPAGLPADGPSRALLRTHWGWDPGAWELTRRLSSAVAASAVGGRWSRLFLDLNRPPGDPTLVRHEAGGVQVSWNLDLGPEEMERRILDWHVPYHAEIDRLVVRRVVRGIRPLLLAIHTFTPALGRSRRTYAAGVLYTADGDLARRLARGLRDEGLEVRYNEPYSGRLGMMYAAERHGSHHRVPCLELELNQGHLADPAVLESRARAVASALAPVLRAVRERPEARRSAPRSSRARGGGRGASDS